MITDESDSSWMEYAPCKDQKELFFPSQSEVASARNRHQLLPGQVICQSCIHQSTCLNYALDNGLDYGIWGGTLERQRRRLRVERNRFPRALP